MQTRPRPASLTSADILPRRGTQSGSVSPISSDSEENYKQVHDAAGSHTAAFLVSRLSDVHARAVMSAVLMDQHAELQGQYSDLEKEVRPPTVSLRKADLRRVFSWQNHDLKARLSQLEASRAEHDRLSTQVSLLEAQLRGAQQSQSLLQADLGARNRIIEELKQQISKSDTVGGAKEVATLLEQREQYAGWLEGAKSMIEKMRVQIDGLQAQNKSLLDESKFHQQQADEVPKLQSELNDLKKNNRHLKDKLDLLAESPRGGRRGSEPVKPNSVTAQRLEPLIRAVGVSVANDIALLQEAVAEAQRFEAALRTADPPVKLSAVLLDCTSLLPDIARKFSLSFRYEGSRVERRNSRRLEFVAFDSRDRTEARSGRCFS